MRPARTWRRTPATADPVLPGREVLFAGHDLFFHPVAPVDRVRFPVTAALAPTPPPAASVTAVAAMATLDLASVAR